MFFGAYDQSLTGKGRILLPKKMRSFVQGDSIVLSKGFEPCIAGYPLDRWEASTKPYLDQSLAQKQSRELRRYLFSSADVTRLDSQGRFIVPQNLLEYANIADEIVVVGVGDHFEIWSIGAWKTHQANIEGQKEIFDKVAL